MDQSLPDTGSQKQYFVPAINGQKLQVPFGRLAAGKQIASDVAYRKVRPANTAVPAGIQRTEVESGMQNVEIANKWCRTLSTSAQVRPRHEMIDRSSKRGDVCSVISDFLRRAESVNPFSFPKYRPVGTDRSQLLLWQHFSRVEYCERRNQFHSCIQTLQFPPFCFDGGQCVCILWIDQQAFMDTRFLVVTMAAAAENDRGNECSTRRWPNQSLPT